MSVEKSLLLSRLLGRVARDKGPMETQSTLRAGDSGLWDPIMATQSRHIKQFFSYFILIQSWHSWLNIDIISFLQCHLLSTISVSPAGQSEMSSSIIIVKDKSNCSKFMEEAATRTSLRSHQKFSNSSTCNEEDFDLIVCDMCLCKEGSMCVCGDMQVCNTSLQNFQILYFRSKKFMFRFFRGSQIFALNVSI